MKKKQNINCDVETCRHQDSEKCVCELDEIKVSCNCDCNNDDVKDNEETICASFEKENDNNDDEE